MVVWVLRCAFRVAQVLFSLRLPLGFHSHFGQLLNFCFVCRCSSLRGVRNYKLQFSSWASDGNGCWQPWWIADPDKHLPMQGFSLVPKNLS